MKIISCHEPCGEKPGSARPTALLLFLSLLLVFLAAPGRVCAEPAAGPGKSSPVKVTVDAASFYQPATNVSGGGDMTVMGGMTAVNATSSVSKKVDLGLGLMYEYEDYRFSKLTRFAVADPWNKINRVGLSGRVSYRLTPRYAVFLSPVVQYAAEEGADPGRSILYGATAGVGYVTEGGSYVGLGAGVFSRLDQTTVFPALIISWKITDRLRLGNSYRTGPAGPAGFELAYTLDEKWKLAFGAGYRSYRFRLSDSSNAPGGVGQITAVPVYLALSRKLGEHLELSLYGGAAFAGGLRVEDRTGERIDSANYNTAPLLGVGFSSSF